MEDIIKIISDNNYIQIEYYNSFNIKLNIFFSLKKIDENGQVTDTKQYI